MKLNTLYANLTAILGQELSTFTELHRALKEGLEGGSNLTTPDHLKGVDDGIDPAAFTAKSGPGGGLEASPFRAAFVLLAFMINGPRRNAIYSTWQSWHLSRAGSELAGWGADWQPKLAVCELSGQHLFGNALKAILADETIAARVREVRVDMAGAWAEIAYDDKVSRFEDEDAERSPNFGRAATISGPALKMVASLIK